jgi:hypothetical protein
MDLKNLDKELANAVKKFPLEVQADLNEFIQSLGGSLKEAVDNKQNVESEMFDKYEKTKENLKSTIDKHNKMQSKYVDNSKK